MTTHFPTFQSHFPCLTNRDEGRQVIHRPSLNKRLETDLFLKCALEVSRDLLLEADAAAHLALAQLRQQLRRQSVVRRRQAAVPAAAAAAR